MNLQSPPGFIQLLILPLLLWAGCLSMHPARANDAAFSGAGGTPKPMRGEHCSIAMQSEKIVIVADAKFYNTTVDFLFRNDGPATKVQMGFPENSFGDAELPQKPAFLRFATFVDGQQVPAKRVVIDRGEDSDKEAYWVKTVTFGRHQVRRVRVAYRSPMGGTTMWGTNNALVYDFTGQNWKGLVERSDLEVHIKAPGLWIGLPKWDEGVMPMSLEGRPNEAVFKKPGGAGRHRVLFCSVSPQRCSSGCSTATPFPIVWRRARFFAAPRLFGSGRCPKHCPTTV